MVAVLTSAAKLERICLSYDIDIFDLFIELRRLAAKVYFK
jgi:hypothetical protein